MTSALSLLALLSAITGSWQSFTNTGFVNGLAAGHDTLYLATNGGLQLFHVPDSTFLEAYTNTEGLPTNSLLCCVADRSGNIWIGTDGGGLVIFNPADQSFVVYPPDRLSVLRITCLAVSGDTVLVGSENGVSVIYTAGTPLDFSDDPPPAYLAGLTTPSILSIGVGRDFWFGSNTGVDRVSRDLDTIIHVSTHAVVGDTVKSILQKDDTLFLFTEWGIAWFDYASLQPQLVALFPQTHVVYDATAYNHLLYVALNGAVWRWTGSRFETVISYDARALVNLEDLWVGLAAANPGVVLQGLGLTRLTTAGALSTFLPPGLASANVSSVVMDTGGEIFATHFLTYGGYRGTSHRRADGRWETLMDTIAHSCLVARDSKNRIWFGHWGVYQYNGGVSVLSREPDSVGDTLAWHWKPYTWGEGAIDYRNVIVALGIDRFDTKWIYNQVSTGEVVAMDSNDVPEYFHIPGVGAPSSGGYEFAFDEQNRVWFGTTAGLAMLDYKGTLHDQHDDVTAVYSAGLQSANVWSVAIDQQGRPWVATVQGAGVLENGQFRMYSTTTDPQNHILSDDVLRVRADDRGNMWFLTDKGMSVLNLSTGKWSQPDENRGLMPNLAGHSGFYAWLNLDNERQEALIGSVGGISLFRYQFPPETSFSAIEIRPNPYVQGQAAAQRITFASLPDSVQQLDVYTLAGEKVADSRSASGSDHLEFNGPNQAYWDVRNVQGRDVASGIYLLVVVTPKHRQVCRFAIVR